MNEKIGAKMQEVYHEQYKTHGYSPKTLGCPKGRQHIRFKALSRFVQKGARVLDFGCGFGDLLGYLNNQKIKVDYHGCDVVDDFLDLAQKKNPDGKYFKVGIGEDLNEQFDCILSSGVFNFLYIDDKARHQEEVFSTLERMFKACNGVLSIDFQSPFVDFIAPDAYHQSINELIGFVVENFGRRFQIDHSYMPYEYCIHIFKDDEVLKPNNVFRS